MSNCKEYKKLMQSVLDGAADERDIKRLELHMAQCMDCSREFKVFKTGLDLLTSMPFPEPGAEFTANTVKVAFAAKKKLRQQQKIGSWCFSGLIAIVSLFILAGWSITIRPAIMSVLSNILGIISEWRILLKVFNKVLATLVKDLITSGNDLAGVIWKGCSPVVSGYLIALILMVFLILITGVKSSALSFRRR